jgi:hypothetical protein
MCLQMQTTASAMFRQVIARSELMDTIAVAAVAATLAAVSTACPPRATHIACQCGERKLNGMSMCGLQTQTTASVMFRSIAQSELTTRIAAAGGTDRLAAVPEAESGGGGGGEREKRETVQIT